MHPDQAQACLGWRTPTESFTAAETAEHLAPGDPIVLRALSLFYSESGDYDKAAECASKTHADPGAYPRAIQLLLAGGKARAGD
jgi:hypothetical protein